MNFNTLERHSVYAKELIHICQLSRHPMDAMFRNYFALFTPSSGVLCTKKEKPALADFSFLFR